VKNMQDAVVVGGGPAGSFFALELAKRGFEVTVFEEHKEIGRPSHCAGHLSIKSLTNLGLYPLPKSIVENTFSAANFYSPNGAKFSVNLSKSVTCAVNRTLFDQHLFEKAKTAGAKFQLDTRVEELLIENRFVKGVKIKQAHSEITQVPSRLVVDGEGISSTLVKQAGLQPLRGTDLVLAVEAEVENVREVDDHAVEVYLGEDYAPGFYAWLIPRLDGTAKVGLATQKGNPKAFLQEFMRKHPVASKQLKNAKVTRSEFHAITLGGSIPKVYSNGFLAVGDCASQVKPTTGGGVIFSVTCAIIAAEVASKALKENNLSEDTLKPYQKQFNKKIGFDMDVMLKARHALNTFSDKKIDRAVQFANKIGLDKALCDVEEIDFQGRTLLTMLRKPAVYTALAYLIGLYLS
jgi:digeranylgeranylglycerophospholipid reductase